MTNTTALLGFPPLRYSVINAPKWLRLYSKQILWSPIPTSSLLWPAAVFNKQGPAMYCRLGQEIWYFCSVPFRPRDHPRRMVACFAQEFAGCLAGHRGRATTQMSNLVQFHFAGAESHFQSSFWPLMKGNPIDLEPRHKRRGQQHFRAFCPWNFQFISWHHAVNCSSHN